MASEKTDLSELRETAEAAAALAANPDAFKEAADAFLAGDATRFEAALVKAELVDRCPLICRFFCWKHCVGVCSRFCPEPGHAPDAREMLEFAQHLAGLMKDEPAVEGLLAAISSGNADEWKAAITRLKLGRFCHQLCHFLCSVRCRRVCRHLCARPLITRVGSIPVDQITPLGFGNGPGLPPFHVGAPDFVATGNHPFGASVWLMGVFNFPAATQYRLQVADLPGGPYTAIDGVPVPGYNQNPVPPPTNIYLPPPGRLPVPASGGWYNISEIPSSDGGPLGNNEKTLMYWPSATVADGVHYLRLQVRDAVLTTRVSSPQIVVIDNSGPFPLPRPTISLELQKPDGTVSPLKCGKVKKGQGLIRVTIHAFDPNLSGVSVTARGNSGLSIPVEGIPLPLFPGGAVVPLSKTYNGNLAEQGYPVPTSFVWDPFNDPRFVPCCYLVYVEVNDRTILNDHYSGGHYNAGWEAIEIGI
jgi:hypothetical protein